MRILVVGSKGSMGRRYCAILRYLKEEVITADIGDPWWEWDFDRVIIATPTGRHNADLLLAMPMGKPILCEKPISKSASDVSCHLQESISRGVDVRMCSNWKYAINLALTRAQKVAIEGEMEIEYSYYDSGKDGFFWDVIQLLHLAGRFKYDRTRPAIEAKVNGIDVTLEHIHASYVLMVSEWLHGDKGKLWSLEDAVKANRKVEEAMRLDANPSIGQIEFREA